MPNLRPFTATAQPLTPFSGVKMRNFLASGQINGQFSLIEGIKFQVPQLIATGSVKGLRKLPLVLGAKSCSARTGIHSKRHQVCAPRASLRNPIQTQNINHQNWK